MPNTTVIHRGNTIHFDRQREPEVGPYAYTASFRDEGRRLPERSNIDLAEILAVAYPDFEYIREITDIRVVRDCLDGIHIRQIIVHFNLRPIIDNSVGTRGGAGDRVVTGQVFTGNDRDRLTYLRPDSLTRQAYPEMFENLPPELDEIMFSDIVEMVLERGHRGRVVSVVSVAGDSLSNPII